MISYRLSSFEASIFTWTYRHSPDTIW
jgi:hypothetical protein